MSNSKRCLRRNGLSLFLALFFLFAASGAFAYTWTVEWPKDLDGKNCHIFTHDRTGNGGSTVMNPGETWTWSSGLNGNSPLSTIDGWCENPPGPVQSSMHLVSRTCDGQDFTTSVSGNISCSQNVHVKLCQKGAGGDAGFCPY